MEKCAKCGKELGWADRNKIWNTRQLKKGYIHIIGEGRIDCPEYTNKKLCVSCAKGLLHPELMSTQLKEPVDVVTSPFKRMKDSEYSSCINGLGLLEGETIKLQYVCSRQVMSRPSVWDGKQRMESHKGLLVFTDDNMIFMQQEGIFSSNYAQALRIPIESIAGLVSGGTLIKHMRFTVGVSGASQQYEFSAFYSIPTQKDIFAIRAEIEKHLKEARENKKAQKEKATVQVILDFSSLKEAMSKGGLIMSTYKCPNCNGMVDIPEAGKILVCKYCGTPIKPVDIFEKIKSLIQ